ncbi:hypothetical protein N9N67_00865 [Bacteriovoracaceae bacterium]|nr:hypothetical protein [Bacteriovoracaceae bacterium]
MWAFLTFFLLVQFFIGFWISRRIKNNTDFFLAGRSLPSYLIVFSLFATWFGAETCIGTSSEVYTHGLSGSRADPIGYSLCLLLFGLLIVRKFYSSKFVTLADFYKSRFHFSIEKLSVMILVPSSLIWGAAQIKAFGQIISFATDLTPEITLSISFFILVSYTLLGGLLGDIITDLIQGILITIGLIAILVITLNLEIDWSLALSPERLSFTAPGENIWQRIDRLMIPIFGSLVSIELISRILAAKNKSIAIKSTYYSSIIYFFVGSIPVFLGLMGPSLVKDLPNSENFLFILAKTYLPSFIAPLFIGALISAILATIDSILISSTAMIEQNFIEPFIKEKTDQFKLKISRTVLITLSLFSFATAYSSDGIYQLVETASSFGTAGILVITLFGLWGKRGHILAPLVTLILGLILHPIFEHYLALSAPYFASIIVCFLAYFLLSTLEKRPAV